MAGEKPEYYAFLMRLWVVGHHPRRIWRFSLNDPQTHEIQGFETLESLFDHLESLLAEKDDEEEI